MTSPQRYGLSDSKGAFGPQKAPEVCFCFKEGSFFAQHNESVKPGFEKGDKKGRCAGDSFSRRTYASNFVMSQGDIFALSKLLGHTSVEMTAKKYAALHPLFMKEVVHTVEFRR